jgi:hypothetical protein
VDVVDGVVIVDGADVAVAIGGSGREGRGWERCCGAVVRPGGQCRRSRGLWGWFGAGEGMVVVVVDVVCVVDDGCACVARGDLASSGGVLGCVSTVCVAVSVIRGVVCVLTSTVVAASVWQAVPLVLGFAWVPTLMLVRIRGVDTSGEAQRPSPWFNIQSSLSSSRPCAFPSKYACSYFTSRSSLPSSSPDSWPSLHPFLYARSSAFSLLSSPSFLPRDFPSSNAALRTFSSSLPSSSLARYLPSSYPSE